jgi:hypothetical protein
MKIEKNNTRDIHITIIHVVIIPFIDFKIISFNLLCFLFFNFQLRKILILLLFIVTRKNKNLKM